MADALGRIRGLCLALPEMVDEEPDRFFVPPYVGGRGWLGVCLDRDADWTELAGIVDDAYRMVAPRSLVATLDQPPP